MIGIRLSPRQQQSWEVVVSKAVQPVHALYEDADVEIASVSPNDVRGSYTFDLAGVQGSAGSAKSASSHMPNRTERRQAVKFARQLLLKEVMLRHEYNALLVEGWKLTVLRKSDQYRLQVTYIARPASTLGLANNIAGIPPFLEMLDAPERW